MNSKQLAITLRMMARGVDDDGCNEPQPRPRDTDVAQLINVLARIVEGKSVKQAFGAPGDWGYGTPIGESLRVHPMPEVSRVIHIPTGGTDGFKHDYDHDDPMINEEL